MTFSLNEVTSIGKRAARGAGFSWGLAEEAGKAAAWLTARGLPGPQQLVELLTRNDGKSYEELAPESAEGIWRARSGQLCPIAAGAALCDRAADIAGGCEFELGPTSQPLLLAPFGAGISRLTGRCVELRWSGARLVFTPNRFQIDKQQSGVTARSAESVTCRCVDEPVPERSTPGAEHLVDAETWTRLDTFAHRTLAPANEASRLAGAGAGLTDND